MRAPHVAYAVVWPETLALLRWNLAAYLNDHEAPDDPEHDGPSIAAMIAEIDAAAAERGAGPWDATINDWGPPVDWRPLSRTVLNRAGPFRNLPEEF